MGLSKWTRQRRCRQRCVNRMELRAAQGCGQKRRLNRKFSTIWRWLVASRRGRPASILRIHELFVYRIVKSHPTEQTTIISYVANVLRDGQENQCSDSQGSQAHLFIRRACLSEDGANRGHGFFTSDQEMEFTNHKPLNQDRRELSVTRERCKFY